MENPWKKITDINRIAGCDEAYVKNHQQNKNSRFLFTTVELPEPFIGNPNAPVYILLGSPGMGPNAKNYIDLEKQLKHESKDKYISFVKSLIFQNCNSPYSDTDYPFYPLNPQLKKFDYEGNKTKAFHREFWRYKVFGRLIEEFKRHNDLEEMSEEDVLKIFSNAFFNVELYGYHSHITEHSLLNRNNRLPSVNFTINLVKKAMKEDKMILMPRAVKTWFHLIPGLDSYHKAYFVSVNRIIEICKSTLSPLPYNALMKKLKDLHENTTTYNKT